MIIIIARNNLHLTKRAVASALGQDRPCTVLLVDNASDDGTLQWARTKNIATLLQTRQVSLARCWNDALSAAWMAGHERALVCNNDVELRPDTYSWLMVHGGPFVTCVSVDNRGQFNESRPYTECPWDPFDTERPHPDFSCFMIRRDTFRRVGLFDEAYYPAYCEDCDYHVRMHRAGIQAVCIDLPFLHHGAATLKNAPERERRFVEWKARENREKFRVRYGCLPGTPEYEKLFTVPPAESRPEFPAL